MTSPCETRREFLAAAGSFGAVALNAASTTATTSPAFGPRTIDRVASDEVTRFRAAIAGKTVAPGESGYDDVRRVWNAAFDRHPGLIAMCASPADVVRAVNFARDQSLLLAVRSGGHSLAGKSTCDGGLVIDLSQLKNIEIDPKRRIVRAGAGLTLAEFDTATHAQGLAVTTGTEPTTGIAGLTLGGGLGWLMGKYGLTCDNLRSVEVVLADGREVVACPATNPDLFWAVRGAGANFGVATSFEYDLHPVRNIFGGVIQYPMDALGPALNNYREFTKTLPDEVGIAIGIAPGANGQMVASLAVCYCGPGHAGETALKPLRAMGPKLRDSVREISYLDFQTMGGLPKGLRLSSEIRSAFLTDLSDNAIQVITQWAATAPGYSGSFVIEYVHGAVCRVGAGDTAFPHRSGGHNFSIHADWVMPNREAAARAWGAGFWQSMQPYIRPAVYSNFLADEGPDRARAAYGTNYARLAQLKRRYDPTNLFRLNQNIVPA